MADETSKSYTEEEVQARIAEIEKGLKANRDEALREAKAAKAKLQNYEGVDPEEFRRLKTAAEEAERKKAAAEGNFQNLEKQLVERHKVELAQRESKIEKLTKALERHLVDAELTRAIAAKKGQADMLLPYARQFVRVRESEDGFEGYVVDERGNPQIADGNGTPKTYATFVEQDLMTKFPRAFDGTGSNGGGAARSAGGASGSPTIIAANDAMAFLKNLEGIAKQEVSVKLE